MSFKFILKFRFVRNIESALIEKCTFWESINKDTKTVQDNYMLMTSKLDVKQYLKHVYIPVFFYNFCSAKR